MSTLTGQYYVIGSANGTLSIATFAGPIGFAEDSSGNIYVAENGNAVIREITPGGMVSTFAGQVGVDGSTNATGTSATFNSPEGLAIDSNGNLYVADAGNELIREITPGGVVSTYAGSGARGSANGSAATASFNGPYAVALDSTGNLYVADIFNNLIREISVGGVVSTFAGSGTAGFVNGTGTAASFNTPRGVAVDSFGNVYVSDYGNHAIRKITSAGVVTTFATGVTPEGISVDAYGYVYVADQTVFGVSRFTPGGVETILAGSGTQAYANGTGIAASFNYPQGIMIDTNCHIYVGDTEEEMIREIQ